MSTTTFCIFSSYFFLLFSNNAGNRGFCKIIFLWFFTQLIRECFLKLIYKFDSSCLLLSPHSSARAISCFYWWSKCNIYRVALHKFRGFYSQYFHCFTLFAILFVAISMWQIYLGICMASNESHVIIYSFIIFILLICFLLYIHFLTHTVLLLDLCRYVIRYPL